MRWSCLLTALVRFPIHRPTSFPTAASRFRIEDVLGHETAANLAGHQLGRSFGGQTIEHRELLDGPADLKLAPPVPSGLRKVLDEVQDRKDFPKALAERLSIP